MLESFKNFFSTAKKIHDLILGVMVVVALFMAFYGSGKSLWSDEAYSVFIARLGFSDALRELSADTHPPFYYFLLTLWTKLFGYGESALRALSAVFYFASILFGKVVVPFIISQFKPIHGGTRFNVVSLHAFFV